MSKRNRKSCKRLLPYEVIQAASKGDTDAVCAVLRHYEGYIARLATRQFYDEYGNVHLCVDEAMRHRLEVKLITGILSFEPV